MMTQNLGAGAVNEGIVSQIELEKTLENQAKSLTLTQKVGFDIKPLEQATENILGHAVWLACQKKYLNKLDFRHLVQLHGWSSKESNRYLKVATTFSEFRPIQLAQVEPATIFQLANQSKKYQIVIDQLKDLPEINQAVVKGLMDATRKPKAPKQEKSSIWRANPDGSRYAQIPPIHEQETGVILQEMMEAEGKTAQSVISEAMRVFKLYKEGLLVPVSQESVNTGETQEFTDINEKASSITSEEEPVFIFDSYVGAEDKSNVHVNFDEYLQIDYWHSELEEANASNYSDSSNDLSCEELSVVQEISSVFTFGDSEAIALANTEEKSVDGDQNNQKVKELCNDYAEKNESLAVCESLEQQALSQNYRFTG